MASVRTITQAFNAGEVSPEFVGRIEQAAFQSGLALCRNFIVLPHGPVVNRPGFAYVRSAKHADRLARLIPFVFSSSQSFAIEFGDLYCRFHTGGATLESSPGTPYEVATPYAEADLAALHYVQSNDIITLVHPNSAPRELRRLSATTWSLTTITFGSALAAPGSVVATATVGTGSTTYSYRVAAVGADGLDEGVISATGSCTNDLLTSGNKNTVTWSAVTGASRYRVYKESNGLYGYIGEAGSTSFVDENIAPDISSTPPETNNPLAAPGSYPAAVSYFEQRRCFAGTMDAPSNLWCTKSGTESNLTYRIPTRDDDALQFRLASREANAIQHLAPLGDLIALSGSAEWRIGSVNADALTPSTISVKPQSYVGSNAVQPVVASNNILFAAARGGHLREMGFAREAGGFVTGDLSLRATHLFDNFDIVDLAYAKAPQPVVWAVSSTGSLLGLTYVPEQQVGAWHQHDTGADGAFESICVVPEGNEDVLYAVVRRTIGGSEVRYIERLASRNFLAVEDAFLVDSGATYSGAATTSITGLTWLEGQTVSILADGAEHPQRTVASGAVTLDWPASLVHVGLPIQADLQTLPMAVAAQAFGQGRQKNISRVWLRVYRSSGIMAGPSFERLVEFKQRQAEPYGTPPALRSDEVQIDLQPSWGSGAQVCIRQSKPLPLTVVSMTMEAEVAG